MSQDWTPEQLERRADAEQTYGRMTKSAHIEQSHRQIESMLRQAARDARRWQALKAWLDDEIALDTHLCKMTFNAVLDQMAEMERQP